MEGGAQYVRVYNYAFNYLTVTEGLRNMIWLLPYDGSPDPAFYPGKSVADIGGADIYAGNGHYDPQDALYKRCVAVFGASMPIALHECGPIPGKRTVPPEPGPGPSSVWMTAASASWGDRGIVYNTVFTFDKHE
jgi:hypothetical protein